MRALNSVTRNSARFSTTSSATVVKNIHFVLYRELPAKHSPSFRCHGSRRFLNRPFADADRSAPTIFLPIRGMGKVRPIMECRKGTYRYGVIWRCRSFHAQEKFWEGCFSGMRGLTFLVNGRNAL